MVKKTFALMLVVVIAGLLVGCGSDANKPSTSAPVVVGTQVVQPGSAGASTAPASKPSPQPSVAATVVTDAVKVQVFFSNSKLGGDGADCSEASPVERTIPRETAIATAALNQLFAGPTAEEVSQGYFSVFSDETKSILKSVKIKDGVAYVNLIDVRPIIPNAATSCGAASFLGQTTATLKQFPTINKVIFAIEGKPSTFYRWLQLGCGPENNNCDDTPFATN